MPATPPLANQQTAAAGMDGKGVHMQAAMMVTQQSRHHQPRTAVKHDCQQPAVIFLSCPRPPYKLGFQSKLLVAGPPQGRRARNRVHLGAGAAPRTTRP